jgi:hypothetical protein
MTIYIHSIKRVIPPTERLNQILDYFNIIDDNNNTIGISPIVVSQLVSAYMEFISKGGGN